MSKADWIKKVSTPVIVIGTVMYALGVLVLDNELLENLGMLIFALGLIGQGYDKITDKKEDKE